MIAKEKKRYLEILEVKPEELFFFSVTLHYPIAVGVHLFMISTFPKPTLLSDRLRILIKSSQYKKLAVHILKFEMMETT